MEMENYMKYTLSVGKGKMFIMIKHFVFMWNKDLFIYEDELKWCERFIHGHKLNVNRRTAPPPTHTHTHMHERTQARTHRYISLIYVSYSKWIQNMSQKFKNMMVNNQQPVIWIIYKTQVWMKQSLKMGKVQHRAFMKEVN
jgi:hypothetical protein